MLNKNLTGYVDPGSIKNIDDLNVLKAKVDSAKRLNSISSALFLLPLPVTVILIPFVSPQSRSHSSGTVILGFGICLGLAVILKAIASYWYIKWRTIYRSAYKTFFLGRALSNSLKEYHYDARCGLRIMQLQGLRMLNLGNLFKSEDYIEGRYKDVRFIQADLKIGDVTQKADGDTDTDIYFDGLWMVFEFPKRFATRLAVVGNGCRRAIYPRDMEKRTTESSEFNKAFTTYMQDGVEMFYILNPKMMEQMMMLSKRNKGRISFLFADEALHVALNNMADSFEPPVHKKGDLNEREEIERLASEMRVVFDFVDTLELEKNIFKD